MPKPESFALAAPAEADDIAEQIVLGPESLPWRGIDIGNLHDRAVLVFGRTQKEADERAQRIVTACNEGREGSGHLSHVVRHNSKWASQRVGQEITGGLRVLIAVHRKTGERIVNIEDDDGHGITLTPRQARQVAENIHLAVSELAGQ